MKRDHLYVPRMHLLAWLSALCMLASAVIGTILGTPYFGWRIAAAVIYMMIVLLSADEMLHRTAVPVWLLCTVSAIESESVFAWIAAMVFAVCYTVIISGKINKIWLMILCSVALCGAVYMGRVPESLAAAGLLILFPAIRVHNDGKYHPTWGDRIDGRRIRTAPAMEQITAYFMPNRNGANNMFEESVEITQLEQYVRCKRREGLNGFGTSHMIMAAYVRTVAKYPALNRFIAGQKIYSRGEDIALCMTVKKEMRTDAPDSVIKVHLHPRDTAADVYRKFNEQVQAAKDEMENTRADNTAAAFMMIPSLVLKFVMWLLKLMDYFGLIPRFLLEISPFHGSIYFTSMGSLGIKPVYHHLYDFGTVPAFCAFGRKRRAEEIKNGEIVERKYVDLKFNLDERICDGFYYAGAIKHFLRILSHPEVLDTPPETIEQDIV